MAYDFSKLQSRLGEVKEWLGEEYMGIRTGRATPAILDGVSVESYGARVAVPHIASVTIEDARTLRIAPWDKGQLKDLEKAIVDANLGVSVVADGEGLRVNFPELTAETRQTLMKVARTKLEDARVSVRKERDETWNDIQKKQKEGELTEDDKFTLKEEMQKIIDSANSDLEALTDKKEKEIVV